MIMKMNRYINMNKALASVVLALCMPALVLVGCVDSGTDAPDLSQPLKPIFMYNDSISVMPVDIQTRAVVDDPSTVVGMYLTPSRASSLYRFTYGTPVWTGNANVDPGIKYEIFGYLPVNNGITASISGYRADDTEFTSAETHPVLTLSNMDPILTDGLAVITGVKSIEATDDADAATKAAQPNAGCFYYEGKSSNNYVCLLMERIVVCYDIRLALSTNTVSSVDSRYDPMNYAGLRSVRIKKMEMTTSARKKMTATVTFNDKPDGVSPAIQSVNWSTVDGTSEPIEIFNSETAGAEKVLTKDWQEIAFYSMPASLATVILKTTYDVYDLDGNKVRQNCVVENDLTSLLSSISSPQIGTRYTLDMVVKPSYLYQLSNYDIDNPTIVATN